MKNCETCVHWDVWKSDRAFKQGIGECRMVVMFWDASEWEPEERVISPEYKDQKAFVQDGSDYSASLYTRKDFGCVEHKERT